MTLTELQKIFPSATEDTWHQHLNGKGWVQNTSTVADTAYVGPDAQVSGSAWEASPLYIQGSRHCLTHCKQGHIQIGCHCLTIGEWQERYKAIGRMEGYTPEQIEEYGLYIELFAQRDKAVFPPQEATTE